MIISSLKSSLSRAARLASLVFAFALLTVHLHAATDEFRVGVQSEVKWHDGKPPTSGEIQQAKAHQNIYVIAKVQLLESLIRVGEADKPEKLVRPVDEAALANQVRKTLAKNGYQEAVAGGPKPEIVLIVYYGRGYLPNPYVMPRVAAAQTSAFEELGRYNSIYTLDQTRADYAEKAQRAGYEKLVIMVIAVPYAPPPPGQLPQKLWKTIMTADDPEHVDLNAVMPDMLAAAGPYFGGRIETPEAEVWKPLPEGRVILGETKVLEEVKPAPAKK